jgi:hypothetical protein
MLCPFAAAAKVRLELETEVLRFRVLPGLDHHDDRASLAFRQGDMRDQTAALPCQLDFSCASSSPAAAGDRSMQMKKVARFFVKIFDVTFLVV